MQDSENFGDTLFDSYLDSVFVISRSKYTVNSYKSAVNRFRKFVDQNYRCSDTKLVDMIKNQKLDVFKILQEFVIYLNKTGNKPASIKLWLTVAKGYLRHHGIKIYSEDFRQAVKLPKKVRQREEPLTKEILVRLLHNVPAKLQTIILVAITSGMRVGEIVQLKLSDIDFGSKPTKIRIRAETTKTRESRETYLTSEATVSLKDYLNRFFGWKENESNEALKDQLIFGRTSISRREKGEIRTNKIRVKDADLKASPTIAAVNSLINSLKTHTKKVPELARFNENGRNMIHFHAFRKFFRTVVGDVVNRDYAEALIGHHFYMDTYVNLPQDKKLENYLKAEPYLTISDFAKVEKDLSKIAEKEKELEEKYFIFEQFIRTHFVGFPEFAKTNNLTKIEIEKPRYSVSCPKCKKFLGESNSIMEGKLMQQTHQPNCTLLSKI